MSEPVTKTVALKRLKPDPNNDDERDMTPEAMTGLRNMLKRYGLLGEPIIFNKRTGFTVSGHQRVKALLALGETEARVVIVDLDEAEAAALRIGLNNPKTQGTFVGGINNTLDELERERADLYEELNLEGARQKEPKPVEVHEVAVSDVADEFIITITGPVPDQADVLDKLRESLTSLGDQIEVDIIVQKVD